MPPQSDFAEHQAFKSGRGKWSQLGVPHRGWRCVDIADLGQPSQTCAMCEGSEIRYVHFMAHDQYPEILEVGCICAGHMEGDLASAKSRDSLMVSRASKRTRWLTRKWKVSSKGNQYLEAGDFRVIVYPKGTSWGVTVVRKSLDRAAHGRLFYPSSDRAKLAGFDFISRALASDAAAT